MISVKEIIETPLLKFKLIKRFKKKLISFKVSKTD